MTQIKLEQTTKIIYTEAKQFIERTGIYIFFICLILFTQFNWMRDHIHRYTKLKIEARLLLGFIIGMLISVGIINLTKKLVGKAGKEPNTLLKDLSIALSPGIIFIFASRNKIFLFIGAGLCVLTALYIWLKPFRHFVDSIIYIEKFKNTLIIKDNDAAIEISGTYEKSNPQAMQCFLTDMVINYYECSEMKIGQVKVDLSNLEGKDENELKPVIESVARYFNIRIVY